MSIQHRARTVRRASVGRLLFAATLAALGIAAPAAQAGSTFTWTDVSADGNWSTVGNWDLNLNYPGSPAIDDTVVFSTTAGTVTLDVSATIAALNLNNTGADLTLSSPGGSILTLSALAQNATGRTNTISAQLAGTITGTVTSGTLKLTNTNNAFTGTFTVAGGAMLYADGSGSGGISPLGTATICLQNNATLFANDNGRSYGNAVDVAAGASAFYGVTGSDWSFSTMGALSLHDGSVLKLYSGNGNHRAGFASITLDGGTSTLYSTGSLPGNTIQMMTNGPLNGSGRLIVNVAGRRSDNGIQFGGGAGTFTGVLEEAGEKEIYLSSNGSYNPIGTATIEMTNSLGGLFLTVTGGPVTAATYDNQVKVKANNVQITAADHWPFNNTKAVITLGSAANPVLVDGNYTVRFVTSSINGDSNDGWRLVVPKIQLNGNFTLDYNAQITNNPGREYLSIGAIENAPGNVSALNLTKTNNGWAIFTGPTSYTGTTTVSAGTLQVQGAMATSAITVAGGTLIADADLGAHAITISSGLFKANIAQSYTSLAIGGGVFEVNYKPADLSAVSVPAGGTLRLSADLGDTTGGASSVPAAAILGTLELNTSISSGLPALALGNGSFVTTAGASRTYAANLTVAGTATLNIGANALLVTGVIQDGASAGSIAKTGSGTLTLANANTYSGTTSVTAGTLVANVAGALGTGTNVSVSGAATLSLAADGAATGKNITVGNGGYLTLVTQSLANFPTITVQSGGGIAGDLTNASYDLPTRTVTFQDGAMLALAAGTAPTYAQLQAMTGGPTGCILFAGIANASGTYTVGDDGTTNPANIYKGAAFGTWSPDNVATGITQFSGTIAEGTAGAGAAVGMSRNVYLNGAALNSTNTAGGIIFSGTGELRLEAAPLGTATVVTRTGIAASGANPGTTGSSTNNGTDHTAILTLPAASVIPAGFTVNVQYGQVSLTSAAAIAGTLNLKDQATLYGTAFNSGPARPATGTIHVFAGGGVQFANQTNGELILTQGASWTFDPGAMLLLHKGFNTTTAGITGTAASLGTDNVGAKVDYVIDYGNSYQFAGGGIVLGDGRRLTTTTNANGNGTGMNLASGGGGIHVVDSTNTAIISIAASENGQINDVVDFTRPTGGLGVANLQFGDANPYLTFRSYDSGARVAAAQTGLLTFTNAVTVGDLSIKSGTATFQNLLTAGHVSVDAGAFRFQGSPANLAITDLTLRNAGKAELLLPGNSATFAALSVPVIVDGDSTANDYGLQITTSGGTGDGAYLVPVTMRNGAKLKPVYANNAYLAMDVSLAPASASSMDMSADDWNSRLQVRNVTGDAASSLRLYNGGEQWYLTGTIDTAKVVVNTDRVRGSIAGGLTSSFRLANGGTLEIERLSDSGDTDNYINTPIVDPGQTGTIAFRSTGSDIYMNLRYNMDTTAAPAGWGSGATLAFDGSRGDLVRLSFWVNDSATAGQYLTNKFTGRILVKNGANAVDGQIFAKGNLGAAGSGLIELADVQLEDGATLRINPRSGPVGETDLYLSQITLTGNAAVGSDNSWNTAYLGAINAVGGSRSLTLQNSNNSVYALVGPLGPNASISTTGIRVEITNWSFTDQSGARSTAFSMDATNTLTLGASRDGTWIRSGAAISGGTINVADDGGQVRLYGLPANATFNVNSTTGNADLQIWTGRDGASGLAASNTINVANGRGITAYVRETDSDSTGGIPLPGPITNTVAAAIHVTNADANAATIDANLTGGLSGDNQSFFSLVQFADVHFHDSAYVKLNTTANDQVSVRVDAVLEGDNARLDGSYDGRNILGNLKTPVGYAGAVRTLTQNQPSYNWFALAGQLDPKVKLIAKGGANGTNPSRLNPGFDLNGGEVDLRNAFTIDPALSALSTNGGTLTLGTGGSLTLATTAMAGGVAVKVNGGTLTTSVADALGTSDVSYSSGTLSLTGATQAMHSLTVSGNLTMPSTMAYNIAANLAVGTGAILTMPSANSYSIAGTIANNGTIQASGGALVLTPAAFTGTGAYSGGPASLTLNAPIVNAGTLVTLNVSGGTVIQADTGSHTGGTNVTAGTLRVTTSGTALAGGPVSIGPSGELQVNTAGTATFAGTGTLTNDGLLHVAGGTADFGTRIVATNHPIATVTANTLQERWFLGNDTDANITFSNAASLLTLTPAAITSLTGALSYANAAAMNTASGGVLPSDGDHFSGAWVGTLTAGVANMPLGTYTFGTYSDDGSSLYIDTNQDGVFQAGELIVNNLTPHSAQARVGTYTFTSPGTYNIAVGFYENAGGEVMEARFGPGMVAQADYSTLAVITPGASSQAGIFAGVVPGSKVQIDAASTLRAGGLTTDLLTMAGTATLQLADQTVVTPSAVNRLAISGTTPTANVQVGTNGQLHIAAITAPAGSTLSKSGAGVLSLDGDSGTAASHPLSVAVTSGQVTFGSSHHLMSLQIGTGATATVAASASPNGKALVTNALAITGGKLDLGNNDLIQQVIGTASDVEIAYGTLLTQVEAGAHGGLWDGTAGITSSAAAGSELLRGLALAKYADIPGSTGTFDGEAVDANSVLIKYTYMGDANMDGTVDATDYGIIDAAYTLTHPSDGSPPPAVTVGWLDGDFNYDGQIDGQDYFFIDRAYFSTHPLATVTPSVVFPTAAPEPGSLGLLVLGAGALLRRRAVRR